MAAHQFFTREELLQFHRAGRGYLLNQFRNCLHETTCPTYKYNPPGLNYTRRGFDSPEDVLTQLGPESSGRWYPCQTCQPDLSIEASARSRRPAPPPRAIPGATATASAAPVDAGGRSRPADVLEGLRKVGRDAPRFTTGIAEADALVYSDPFAFLLACSIDRGMPSGQLWRIPYRLKQHLGNLDPATIGAMTPSGMLEVLDALPEKPRYKGAAAETLVQVARLVHLELHDDAARLWTGRHVRDIKRMLLGVRGIGDGIANMTVHLLIRYLGVEFPWDQLRDVDVKPDVHVERVFLRTGLISGPGQSVQAARELSPHYPADLDYGAWEIGRRWCHASSPDHTGCPLGTLCPRHAES